MPERNAEGAGELLRAAMDKAGITDRELRAGIAAIAIGESALQPKSETGYANTANSRIRKIFGARVSALSDKQLDELKRDDVAFFEKVYGGEWGSSKLGNVLPGDGYSYRGRGFFQLTGRDNYKRYGQMIGADLIGNPDLANEPKIAAEIAVVYMRDRYKGGGWNEMKRVVGNPVAGVEELEDALFKEFLSSGEYDAVSPPEPPGEVEAAIETFTAASRKLQERLQNNGFYRDGILDGDWGPMSRRALREYRAIWHAK